jgi:hypothetical protein
MRLTPARLSYPHTHPQYVPISDMERVAFKREFPRGCAPDVEHLTQLAQLDCPPLPAHAHDQIVWTTDRPFDVLALVNLLPHEGPGSQRAFALWCAEATLEFAHDWRILHCHRVLRHAVTHYHDCQADWFGLGGRLYQAGRAALEAVTTAPPADSPAGYAAQGAAWAFAAAAENQVYLPYRIACDCGPLTAEAAIGCLAQLLTEA